MKIRKPILYILLYTTLGFLGYHLSQMFYTELYVTKNVFENVKTIDQSSLKFDYSMFVSEYIPSLDQEGLRVTFEETTAPRLVLTLSLGIYRLDFYYGNSYIDSMNVDFQYEYFQFVDIPFETIEPYDSIIIYSLTDSNNKLNYLKPLQTDEVFDQSIALVWDSQQSSVSGSRYNLDPHREYIDAITANLVSESDDAITINVRNISGSNIQLLEFFELGSNTMYHLNDVMINQDTFGKDTLITIPNADIDFKEDYAIYYKYEEYDDIKAINVSLISNDNDEIVGDSKIVYQDFETYKNYFNENNSILTLKTSDTHISEAVLIPSGYSVQLNAGDSISFSNDGFIRSYSAIDFSGTQDMPITISAVDDSQSGIAVVQASTTSNIEYTVFDNLTNILVEAYHTTGALNFYESDLVMTHSTISNNRSEDGLNVVRSHFDVSDSLFEYTYSDAFDSDFSTGTLINSEFIYTGNDAFDCSGSTVEISDIDFINIGDKALSIGEHTSITGTNLVLDTMDLGIAIKDSSSAIFEQVQFIDTYLSFVQYNKKPVFGVSSTRISNVSFSGDIGLEYLIQEHEHLVVDDEVYIPENLSKSEQIFDAMINERPIR